MALIFIRISRPAGAPPPSQQSPERSVVCGAMRPGQLSGFWLSLGSIRWQLPGPHRSRKQRYAQGSVGWVAAPPRVSKYVSHPTPKARLPPKPLFQHPRGNPYWRSDEGVVEAGFCISGPTISCKARIARYPSILSSISRGKGGAGPTSFSW